MNKYRLEFDNGLSRVIYSRESSFLKLKFMINEEGLRSIATIPQWDISEDLQVRKDGLYENAHLVEYTNPVKESTDKPS